MRNVSSRVQIHHSLPYQVVLFVGSNGFAGYIDSFNGRCQKEIQGMGQMNRNANADQSKAWHQNTPKCVKMHTIPQKHQIIHLYLCAEYGVELYLWQIIERGMIEKSSRLVFYFVFVV